MTKIAFSFLVYCLFCFHFHGICQNLVSDPSFENFDECPTQVGVPEFGLDAWEIFRGSPNIFSECSDDFPAGWNTGFGYQPSRTGQTHIGLITYFDIWQSREYVATRLLDSLQIGQEYYIEFHTSLAYNFNATMFKSTNLGVLLMTENFFTQDEMDPTINFAHLNVDTMIGDTTNWVKVHGYFEADSSYKYLALGNFYNDNLTSFEFAFEEVEDGILAYYFIDDVCISTDSILCNQILSTSNELDTFVKDDINVYPNPIANNFVVKLASGEVIEKMCFISLSGIELFTNLQISGSPALYALPRELSKGLYILQVHTVNGKAFQRKVIVE